MRPGDEAGAYRRAGMAGLVFVAVDLVATAGGGRLPWIDDPPADLAAFYADGETRLLAQAFVRGLAMGLLVWFAAQAEWAFGRVDGGLARVLSLALLAVAGVELVRVVVVAAVVLRPPGDAALPALHAAGLMLGAVIAFPIAAAQVALCLLLRRLGASVPTWLVPVGAGLAVLWVATAIRAVFRSHALWTAGTVVTAAWGVWLVAVCVVLWTRAERLAASAR